MYIQGYVCKLLGQQLFFFFFTSFITKQLQGYVHIHIQIQGYIQTLTYLIFYSTNFVDMFCIFLFLLHISICF